MSQPDMGSICHIKNQWNILVKGNYYVNYQNLILEPPRILNEHWCIYSCLQIPPKENWFHYVRRVYTTKINFPCITPLITCILNLFLINNKQMYSPGMYKYRDSYVLYTYSIHLRFGKLYTHSFGTDTHTWGFHPLLFPLSRGFTSIAWRTQGRGNSERDDFVAEHINANIHHVSTK